LLPFDPKGNPLEPLAPAVIHEETAMRAEIEAAANEIRDSLTLLRRHL
jgi:hypothetical protein